MSSPIPWLERDTPFPLPPWRKGPFPGLVAGGGDLSPGRLLQAYRQGLFPWYEHGDPILWWSPDPRGVIVPAELHIARRLRRDLPHYNYRIVIDHDFMAVMQGCAMDRPGETGTWIHPEMIDAYVRLFHLGHAHAFAVYDEDELIGGLYGVTVGRIFCAESMFSRQSNASKLALIASVLWLAAAGCPLIDTQLLNPHIARLGAKEIPRASYLAILKREQSEHLRDPWQTGRDLMPWLQQLDVRGSPRP